MKKILVLSSNPKGTSSLDLDRELRDIRETLRRSEHRDEFVVETREAVRPADLRRAMLEVKPRIVHFCGHGSGLQGLMLEDDGGQEHLVSTKALADLFRIFAQQVECVVLNACYSEVQAQEIVQYINYVIGMNRAVRDDAAISFTTGFYDALGAGDTIDRAFEIGRNAVLFQLSGNPSKTRKIVPFPPAIPVDVASEETVPVLLQKSQLMAFVDLDEPPKGASHTPVVVKSDNRRKGAALGLIVVGLVVSLGIAQFLVNSPTQSPQASIDVDLSPSPVASPALTPLPSVDATPSSPIDVSPAPPSPVLPVEPIVSSPSPSVTPSPELPASPTFSGSVYFQIADEAQRGKAEAIAASLRNAGYAVAEGIENVSGKVGSPQTMEVRYFNDTNELAAEKIATILQSQTSTSVRLVRPKELTSRNIEVWFSSND